ncbi:MAG: Farnesyl diphosphate synthase [Chlamydiia bacterium]|nr:Farnesyl diphosphate synthase [Chlamydiia bacterium]
MSILELKKMQTKVNVSIQDYVEGLKNTPLSAPISYSLLSSGKRLRPILTMITSKAVGKGFDVTNAALSIELFHTASLIADDLPCMDDDDLRRNKPSLHKKYSESIALLTSYTLMTEGFLQIEKSGDAFCLQSGSKSNSAERVKEALRETTKLSGPNGAILGQYFDLEQIKAQTEEDFDRLYYLKTGTLFQGAFVLGYIFGGGDLEKVSLIKKLAKPLGMAFQIRDDFEDLDQESLNYVKTFGKEASLEKCQKEIENFLKALDLLELEKKDFEMIISYLFPKELFRASLYVL